MSPKICIPEPIGVPGLWELPPGFISDVLGNPGSQHQDKLDDPRWTGAFRQGFPAVGGTTEPVSFRALKHVSNNKTSLYFSWWTKRDRTGALGSGVDKVYVGFQPGGAGTATIFELVAYNSLANGVFANRRASSFAVNGPTIHTLDNASGSFQTASDPSWADNKIRFWLTDATKLKFAIQMQLDYDDFNLTDNFKMWYSIKTVLLNGIPVYESWPVGVDPTGLNPYPSPLKWQECGIGAGCPALPGVSMENYDDIGILDAGGMYTNTVSRTQPNIFYCRPTNNTGSAIDPVLDPVTNPVPKQIHAGFRVANWGSSCDPTAPFDVIPVLADVVHATAYPTGKPTPAATPLRGTWTLSSDPTIEPDHALLSRAETHQCIQVTLWGAGITFNRDSYYNNFFFNGASLIEKTAEINIMGLESNATVERDVYILVEKTNMPKQTSAGYDEGRFQSTAIEQLLHNQPDSELAKQLEIVLQNLKDAPAMTDKVSKQRLERILSSLREMLLAFKGNDQQHSALDNLIMSLNRWQNAIKTDAILARRLGVLLDAFADWLVSHGDSAKAVEFTTALMTWLSQIESDKISLEMLPTVTKSLQKWLSTIADDDTAARLSAAIEAFNRWLASGRLPDQSVKTVGSLRAWLSNLGMDKTGFRQNLGFLVRYLRDWLSTKNDSMAVLIDILYRAGISGSTMQQIFPTCQYHVFHDTGNTEKLADGTSVPVLHSQGSFGISAYHEGRSDGWQTSIQGATRLAENFYVIKVPNNGVANVGIRIQAVEPGEKRILENPIPGPGCCDALAIWLDTKGSIGKLLAILVRVICRLFKQPTN